MLFNYEYPPLGGGAGNATQQLVKCFLGRSELAVTVITSSVAEERTEHPEHNVTIHFLDIGKRGSLHYQSNIDLLKYSWKAWRYSRRLIRKQRFDVVHAFFGIPCGVIARRLRLPYVVSLRGSDVPGYSRRYELAERLLFRRLSRKIWRNAAAVVANSEGLRTLALSTARNQRIDVIPNGVDTTLFSPPVSRDTSSSTTQQVNLIYVGRLIPRKGVDLILRAMANLTHVHLTVIGDGPERERLGAIVATDNLPVDFLGECEHAALPDLYRQHDAFLLPSYNEGMSNTVLEAMASGLPVIVTEVGGTGELVDGNGIVVRPGDSDAVEAAIRELRDDSERRRRMGMRSRQIALQYSWTAVADAYIAQYQRAYSESGSARGNTRK